MFNTNEGKFVVNERFIRKLKNRTYKNMTSIYAYIDKLDNMYNKYNNTYHRAMKMKPVDIKSSAYISSSKEINNEDPEFKFDDIARLSKYRNNFSKSLCSKLF